MAKRKRLTPANPAYLDGKAPETKMMHTGPTMRAPIADVASDAAATSALEELGQTLATARAQGRMVLSLPLNQIMQDYLIRDRLPPANAGEDSEMDTLVASLRDRGQQMPIEVVALEDGRYGLISGWRRCQAVARLADEGVGEGTILALLRRPEDASDAYLAMVEENEIRVGVSYFERARIVIKAVEQGVYETDKKALLSLFRSASRSKRSKIKSFLSVVCHLDGLLRFPSAIGERMGLQLAQLLDNDPAAAVDLNGVLKTTDPTSPEAEQTALLAFLKQSVTTTEQSLKTSIRDKKTNSKFRDKPLRGGVVARLYSDGRVELRGAPLSTDLRDQMLSWLSRSL